ncbi:MAG: ABC transporter substrate-binding protein [Nanoarchaeota archaeon]|nr:ABC transporter substrate-binding protein [Nanoarchaeota archaeon]
MKKLIAIIMVILFLVTGCGQTLESDSIEIGWISALTGPVAPYGEPALRSAMLEVNRINAEGGINGKPIELIVEDGECNSKTATLAMQKLVHHDKVEVVLGGHCTPETLAAAPIANENKVILFASITTSPAVTDAGDYVFRNSPLNMEGQIIAEHMNKQGFKKIAIINEQTDYAIAIPVQFKEYFDGEVVAHEQFSPDERDFRTILTKIKAAKPEVLFIITQGIDPAEALVIQYKELGFEIPIYGNSAFETPEILSHNEIVEGMIFATPKLDQKRLEEFNERYEERYGIEAPAIAYMLESAAAVGIIAEAIEEVGYDADAIKEYLYDFNDKETLAGKITIDQNGDTHKDFMLKVITDKEIVPLE